MSNGAPFAVLLKEHRLARSLTQDRLAERAGVSAKAVAALESGRRKSPRLSTIALLVDALGLDDEQRAVLARAATTVEPESQLQAQTHLHLVAGPTPATRPTRAVD